ncbi:TIGR03862 family flavoprotein [Humitalea sp. 24SJ18S-53]|uniref:TIGR03862 family flavoprotein n=1 Tax=Humitalea sp. 24SJ18S-53 TaxID=3422307 RepID=UPI003D671579
MTVLVIGAGPAGLMAAETIAAAGRAVVVADRMPSVARKFLMAGRGGLNLTHGMPMPGFLDAYGAARERMAPFIAAFSPADLIAWCEGLGQPVFTGSSGRVFPKAMKASPLLRAWLARLEGLGVRVLTRHEWQGFAADGAALFAGRDPIPAEAVVLALGGASWPRLGSDGAWQRHFSAEDIAPLVPSNCGFRVDWSPHFAGKFAGSPLKRIALTFGGRSIRGEAMITAEGIEGGAIYALSAAIRDAGGGVVSIDLRPDLPGLNLPADRRGQSLSTFLRKAAGLSPVAVGLVQEALRAGAPGDLLGLVKALPLRLGAPMPIARAISSGGGLRWGAVDDALMLRARPGVFVAGEMLDWEAPTGGFLLQGCLATGRAAGLGVLARG